MVYNDINDQQFIGNWLWHKPVKTGDFTVSYHLGWGAGRPMSADRDALPQPGSDLGSDYCSSLPYSFSATICGTPVNVNYIYCLITLATLVAHPKLGLIWFMNQHWNLLWSTLDNNPNPSRFSHIYIRKVLLHPFIHYHHDPILFSLCYMTITLTSDFWYNIRG